MVLKIVMAGVLHLEDQSLDAIPLFMDCWEAADLGPASPSAGFQATTTPGHLRELSPNWNTAV